MSEPDIKIIECPRDAMQGIKEFIPTDTKVKYLNQLLKVGFHTLDCGSFVSPKAIPQMADTKEVIPQLELSDTDTRLSVIVANVRGAKDAVEFEEVDYLGFPFSISETFQQRNTNSSKAQGLEKVKKIRELADKHNKAFVAYLSMAFGNPYGDPWDIEVAGQWMRELDKIGVEYISLSDTIGVAKPDVINYFFQHLTKDFPGIEFGAHFHTTPDTWRDKVEPAYNSGCKRFDGAIKGFGGCPMAKDDLTGNMPTERLVEFFNEKEVDTGLNEQQFKQAMLMAGEVFPF